MKSDSQNRQRKTWIRKRRSKARQRQQSLKYELRQRAKQLGFTRAKSLFPEGTFSPTYGDPTAVDDRPFARV